MVDIVLMDAPSAGRGCLLSTPGATSWCPSVCLFCVLSTTGCGCDYCLGTTSAGGWIEQLVDPLAGLGPVLPRPPASLADPSHRSEPVSLGESQAGDDPRPTLHTQPRTSSVHRGASSPIRSLICISSMRRGLVGVLLCARCGLQAINECHPLCGHRSALSSPAGSNISSLQAIS